MKEEKQEIKIKYWCNIYLSDFEGDTKDIIKFLQDLPEEILKYNVEFQQDSKKYTFIRFGIDNQCYSSDYPEFEFYAIRLETDEEYNKRLEANKKAKLTTQKAAKIMEKNKIEEEKKLFETLKKKYDK